MALTFSKEPGARYPAYNDAYIEFSSSLSNQTYAEIRISPTTDFPNDIRIYADSNGNYVFNLKEIAKFKLNQDGFEDEKFSASEVSRSITGKSADVTIRVRVYNDSTYDEETKIYNFWRKVKQINEPIHTNERQILRYSEDGENFNLNYYPGFPLQFEIQYAASTETITILNFNNADEINLTPSLSDSYRVVVENANGVDWGLTLEEGLNKLDISFNGLEPVILYLNQITPCRGVYLKWFNRMGGYSYQLFDKYYVQNLQSQELGNIMNSDFDNIEDAKGFIKSIGKNSNAGLILKTKYKAEEYENLKDLFNSPSVQMYNSIEPGEGDGYFDVMVEGSFSYPNKRLKNELVILVDLPEIVTAKL